MSLSEAQRDRALAVMEEIESYNISRMFAQPVDPERDNIANYYKIVKTPMDLGTIRKKLIEGQYQSMIQWKDDMDLVWNNSLQVHGKASLMGYITLELQGTYKKLVQHVTDNPDNDWLTKLGALRDELNGFSKKPSKTSVKKETKQVSRSSSQTKVGQVKRPPSGPVFAKNDILKLTSQINSLDEDRTREIFEIIQANEPALKTEKDMITMDVGNLKATTIVLLISKLESWAER